MYAVGIGFVNHISEGRRILPFGTYCGRRGEIWVGRMFANNISFVVARNSDEPICWARKVPKGELIAYVHPRWLDPVRPPVALMIAFDGDRVGCYGCKKGSKIHPAAKLCWECTKTAIGLRAIDMYKRGLVLADKKGA